MKIKYNKLSNHLVRFRKDEDGQLLIEFAILVPLLFTIFLTAMELGIYAMQQMWLDRGLDIAVRYVRLNTDNPPNHLLFKGMVCKNGGFIRNCESSLKVEMTQVDPRAFSGLPANPDCVDSSEPFAPPRNFVPGGNHDLMLIRACLVFDPIFPSTGLGFEFSKAEDKPFMTAYSAFVQEPGK